MEDLRWVLFKKALDRNPGCTKYRCRLRQPPLLIASDDLSRHLLIHDKKASLSIRKAADILEPPSHGLLGQAMLLCQVF